MSETINGIVNNLADRLSEVAEVTRPAIESVNAISQTVVQETANIGFVYTMVGFGILGIACLVILGIIYMLRHCNLVDWVQVMFCWLIAAACLLIVAGFLVVMINFGDWIAPTKQTIIQVITEIRR